MNVCLNPPSCTYSYTEFVIQTLYQVIFFIHHIVIICAFSTTDTALFRCLQDVAALPAEPVQSFAIGGTTLSGFVYFGTYPPPNIPTSLGQLQKGIQYTTIVLCFSSSDSPPTSLLTYDIPPNGETATAATQSGAPQNLVLTTLPQQIALSASWSAPVDTGLGPSIYFQILHYSVELSLSSNFAMLVSVSNISSSQLSAALTGLSKGKTYFCRLRAFTLAGAGNYSQFAGPQTVLGLPSAPTIISSTSGRETTGLRISVTWQLPQDTGDSTSNLILVDQYQVEISNASTLTSSLFVATVVPDLSLSAASQDQLITFDTSASQSAGLNNMIQNSLGSFVYIRVRAHTSLGWGDFSKNQSQIVGSSPGVPGQVELTVCGILSLNLSWNPPQDKGIGPGRFYALTDYVAQLKNSLNVEILISVAPNASSILIESFQDMALTRGQTYYANVQAVNNLGASAFSSSSSQSSAMAVGLSLPPNPVLLCSYSGGTSCAIGSSTFSDAPGALKLRQVEQERREN